MRVSACNGCGNRDVTYGHTNEHTAYIRANTNDIFLDPYISREKQNITSDVNDISNEFTKRPTTVTGEAERIVAA